MLQSPMVFSLLAVSVISLTSFVGLFTLGLKSAALQKVLIYLISFAAGTLLGDVFIHLIPEMVEQQGWSLGTSLAVLSGILISLVLEKVVHWRHCHLPLTTRHTHSFAWMNLFGDSIHNFIDGVVIAASFMVSIPTGFATSAAVLAHEIPQEIGDFGILLHSGFSWQRALWFNFLTALTAVFGAVVAWQFAGMASWAEAYLLPFAAGSFIYIAGSDLIPELHKDPGTKKAILQVLAFTLGILTMVWLLGFE
jgi:zinc and cadmium transporter